MEELRRIIGTAGPAPDAINRFSSWESFGDALWKELKVKHNLKVSKQMHEAKKKGGGVVGIWKSLFPEAALALESGPFAKTNNQYSNGGSSSFHPQPIVCVPVHYQYAGNYYGSQYVGNGDGG